ncbi:MAG: hypothetical protein JXR46_08745 [Calditrichaceae bacterium]|nr:hypothetical protein [Calditrichaceae bacterium]
MESTNLHLLSTYLKKWSFNDNRIAFNYSFCLGEIYERNRIDLRMNTTTSITNDLLNHIFHRAKELLYGETDEETESRQNGNNIILVNESEVKRKLGVYLTRIIKEYNQNKRNRGRARMISTRSLDFYYNDFEFEPLEDDVKFFVHLNRGVNKINGDLWSNAIDDFKLALAVRPHDVRANKNMALALKKIGSYEEAVPYLKICIKTDETSESLETLASAYIHLKEFKKAETIFKKIAKQFPDSKLAALGRAQIAYKLDKPYLPVLDEIYAVEPEWLREKLAKEWDYTLPDYCDTEECKWNAAIAARYLGFERPIDLTKKAFNGEVPCYFDPEKGTIRFVMQELEHWVKISNRYELYPESYKIYPEKITKEEVAKAQLKETNPKPVKKKTKKEKTEVPAEVE